MPECPISAIPVCSELPCHKKEEETHLFCARCQRLFCENCFTGGTHNPCTCDKVPHRFNKWTPSIGAQLLSSYFFNKFWNSEDLEENDFTSQEQERISRIKEFSDCIRPLCLYEEENCITYSSSLAREPEVWINFERDEKIYEIVGPLYLGNEERYYLKEDGNSFTPLIADSAEEAEFTVPAFDPPKAWKDFWDYAEGLQESIRNDSNCIVLAEVPTFTVNLGEDLDLASELPFIKEVMQNPGSYAACIVEYQGLSVRGG